MVYRFPLRAGDFFDYVFALTARKKTVFDESNFRNQLATTTAITTSIVRRRGFDTCRRNNNKTRFGVRPKGLSPIGHTAGIVETRLKGELRACACICFFFFLHGRGCKRHVRVTGDLRRANFEYGAPSIRRN